MYTLVFGRGIIFFMLFRRVSALTDSDYLYGRTEL